MKDFLSKLRKDYGKGGIGDNSLDADPIRQFEQWMMDAANADAVEPNAMVLSTVSQENKPHSRVVLLRNFDKNGFVFYTNYDSTKSHDIEINPHVCLNFFWAETERQVRVEGVASRIGFVKSEEYFKSRPRGNQIAAWASPQSQVISSREELEALVKEMEEKFKTSDILDKPPFWGGFCVRPTAIEFWQGRTNRLHDRILYTLDGENQWTVHRLAP